MAVADTHMTVAEAADEIGVNDSRVRQMIGDGEIKAEKMASGMWLIPKTEVKRVAKLEHKTGRPRGGGKR